MAKSIAELEAVFGQTFSTMDKRLNTIDALIDGLSKKDTEGMAILHEVKKELAVLQTECGALKTWKVEIGSQVDVKSDIAVLKSDIVDLKKMKDAWGQRAWGVAQTIIGVIIGALVTYFIRK